MNWLKTLADELLKKLPPREFSPALIFGFDDVSAAIEIVEKAINEHSTLTEVSCSARAEKAARDPLHNYIDEPVFARMATEFWKAEMTFPMILRRSLFIAICSHVEYALRSWCDFLHAEWALQIDLAALSKVPRESDLRRCVRYLEGHAGLALADFELWPEWRALDGYRVARNCLAHNGGLVEKAADRAKIEVLPEFQVDTSGLLTSHPVVHLLPGACEGAAENAKMFFARLATLGGTTERARRDSKAHEA